MIDSINELPVSCLLSLLLKYSTYWCYSNLPIRTDILYFPYPKATDDSSWSTKIHPQFQIQGLWQADPYSAHTPVLFAVL